MPFECSSPPSTLPEYAAFVYSSHLDFPAYFPNPHVPPMRLFRRASKMAPVKFAWKTKPKVARRLRSSQLDKPPKNPRLRWDREKRFVLCCMDRFCLYNQHQTEKIFSHIFRWHLNERGFMDVVPFRTLHTQLNWMENTSHVDWEHAQEIRFERSAKGLEIMNKIRSAAAALGIRLQEKRSHATHALGQISVVTPHTVPETHTSAMPSPSHSSGSRTLTFRQSPIANQISNRVEPTASVPAPVPFSADWIFSNRVEPTASVPAPVPFSADWNFSDRVEPIASVSAPVPVSPDWNFSDRVEPTASVPAPVPVSPDWNFSDRVESTASVPVPRDWNFLPARPQSGLGTPITEQQSNSSDSEQGYNEPVVTSHRKTCIWCHQDPENDFQIPESEGQIEDTEVPDEVPIHIPGKQLEEPDLEGLHPEKIPPLLYRWFNEDSQGENSNEGFISGLFCEEPSFNREDISDDEFEEHFIHHVTREETPTPFISTSASPLTPIHRAINSDKPASVVVFDTTKLQTPVFYAHPIARHTNTFTQKWKGYGEYLIWGEVPSNAIVFMCPISEVEQLAANHSDINRLLLLRFLREAQFCTRVLWDRLGRKKKPAYKSGRTFGKSLFLLDFPRLYWEHVAAGFMRYWGWTREEDRVNFLKGMKSELPYSIELSDSESEEAPIPHFQRSRRSPPCSDMDFAPPSNFMHSDSSSESEESAQSANESGIMEVRSETADDEHFSTHESMSSFGFLTGSSRRQRRDGIRSVRMLQRGVSSSALQNEISPDVSDQVPSQPVVDRAGVGDIMVFQGGDWSPL
ncbi:unnamed protein product [Penicillium salamii]|uniref:DUF7587 domain-containing protein n=1 Tax=Penicillium salamii TaxID=1612424 RepID=A0A9W4NXB0_9EURO|nr:unnamed protein product [Penicillium salamii]CAG8147585.1 unnamed protein product [Penicillium salamii]CAG8152036.1 unnamed protein product [Penicillium salamii]CAG8244245.1 unnamed protein product [Penicillium salamii]CAG8331928.1 unnamed protein product [Penicillium salamii]